MMAVNCDTVVNLIFCAFPIHNRLCTLNVHGEIYLKNGKVEALEAAHSVNCCNCCYPLSMRIWVCFRETAFRKPHLMACACNPVLWMQRQADPRGLLASQCGLLGAFSPVREAVSQEVCGPAGRMPTSWSYARSLGPNPSQLLHLAFMVQPLSTCSHHPATGTIPFGKLPEPLNLIFPPPSP